MKLILLILISVIYLNDSKILNASTKNSLAEVNRLLKSGKTLEAEKKIVKLVLEKNIQAIRFYAICLIKGNYFKKNIPRALVVLNEGANNNDGLSAYTLGNFFSDGVYFKPKKSYKICSWWRKSFF